MFVAMFYVTACVSICRCWIPLSTGMRCPLDTNLKAHTLDMLPVKLVWITSERQSNFTASKENLDSIICSEITAREAFYLLVLVLPIRTLFCGGGGVAAAVSQQSLELMS